MAGLAVVVALVASACVVNGTWAAAATPPHVTDLTCLTTTWCAGVGVGGATQVWNGTTWESRPGPPLGSNGSGAVETFDCFAVDRCMAFVDRASFSTDITMYLMLWDGSTWSDAPGLPPGDAVADDPLLSCGSDGCLAVDPDERTVRWDGSAITDLGYLMSFVSAFDCVTTSDCLGVASGSTIHWNGTGWDPYSWESDTPPDDYTNISCGGSTNRCIALGRQASPPFGRVSIIWDGSTWAPLALPAGVGQPASVSCSPSFECLAVGAAQGSDSVELTFAGSWYVAPTPPGGATGTYSSVACATQFCLATGLDPSTSTRLASTYGWTYP